MTKLRSVRLAIHLGRHSEAWSLILRTDDGRTVFDRRLHSGDLAHIGRVEGAGDLPTALRQIAADLESRFGRSPSPEAAREPLGAVGGGPDHRPGRVCAHSCPLCGQHLDGMPSDD